MSAIGIRPVDSWLPEGKDAAICLSIDDVHPGRSSQQYDGGGDLQEGALGIVHWLLKRHSQLKVTLFVTADWRETTPRPSPILAAVPVLRNKMFLAPVLSRGSRRVDRAPEFVRYLSQLPRVEIAFHGLHHVHRGPKVQVEFQDENVRSCEATLAAMEDIFQAAGWRHVRGMCPPGWNAPASLVEAMQRRGFDFIASARDIRMPIDRCAVSEMSGLKGVPLMHPARVGNGAGLLHFTTNFQATSPLERALAVIDAGGLLSIKAHIVKNAFGHIALDGVDQTYFNYLDVLLGELKRRYGSRLWWTSMGEIAQKIAGKSR